MRRSSSEFLVSPAGEVAQLDAELYRLARGAGRLRLRIGQALHRLGDGVHELGFSTLGAYALERCCRGGRWAAESRTLARRLHSLLAVDQGPRSRVDRLEHGGAACTACHTSDRNGAAPGGTRQVCSSDARRVEPARVTGATRRRRARAHAVAHGAPRRGMGTRGRRVPKTKPRTKQSRYPGVPTMAVLRNRLGRPVHPSIGSNTATSPVFTNVTTISIPSPSASSPRQGRADRMSASASSALCRRASRAGRSSSKWSPSELQRHPMVRPGTLVDPRVPMIPP